MESEKCWDTAVILQFHLSCTCSKDTYAKEVTVKYTLDFFKVDSDSHSPHL